LAAQPIDLLVIGLILEVLVVAEGAIVAEVDSEFMNSSRV